MQCRPLPRYSRPDRLELFLWRPRHCGEQIPILVSNKPLVEKRLELSLLGEIERSGQIKTSITTFASNGSPWCRPCLNLEELSSAQVTSSDWRKEGYAKPDLVLGETAPLPGGMEIRKAHRGRKFYRPGLPFYANDIIIHGPPLALSSTSYPRKANRGRAVGQSMEMKNKNYFELKLIESLCECGLNTPNNGPLPEPPSPDMQICKYQICRGF